MTGGVVLKRTKGLEPASVPELEQVDPIPETPMVESTQTRDDYILAYAPHLLAALIIRRDGTAPELLAGKACDAVAAVYDHVKRSSSQDVAA